MQPRGVAHTCGVHGLSRRPAPKQASKKNIKTNAERIASLQQHDTKHTETTAPQPLYAPTIYRYVDFAKVSTRGIVA